LQNIVDKSLSITGKGYTIDSTQLKLDFRSWLQIFPLLPEYDVFISYRWGSDQHLAEMLFDSLTNYNVGANNRAIDTFMDNKRLKDGQNFSMAFCTALLSSYIAVPVISVSALQKMTTHDPNTVDNVLLEWLLCITSCGKPNSRLKNIFPILIGPKDGITSTFASLFACGVLNRIPSVVPMSTINAAKDMLTQNNINFDAVKLDNLTVKDIINSLSAFLGYNTEGKNMLFFEECTVKLHRSLQDVMTSNESMNVESNRIMMKLQESIVLDSTITSHLEVQQTIKEQQTRSSVEKAFAIIQDESNVKKNMLDKFREFIDDFGVKRAGQLSLLEFEYVQQLSQYLKHLPQKEFLILLQK
jgi:hypothetical protein